MSPFQPKKFSRAERIGFGDLVHLPKINQPKNLKMMFIYRLSSQSRQQPGDDYNGCDEQHVWPVQCNPFEDAVSLCVALWFHIVVMWFMGPRL